VEEDRLAVFSPTLHSSQTVRKAVSHGNFSLYSTVLKRKKEFSPVVGVPNNESNKG
jgi:hypothetical protein